MKYKALLIDFDNTIIGSENANHLLFVRNMENMIGRKMTREDGYNFRGHTWKEIFKIMSERYLPEMPPQELREIFVRSKIDYFKDKTAPIAAGLSDILALDIKKAIVTGSSKPEVEMFSHLLELDKFDMIVSDELYDKGKPAPDGYAYAVKKFGLEPHQCVAVEDSHIGLMSANAAGCITVFTREFTNEDLSSAADFTVGSIAEVIKLLS